MKKLFNSRGSIPIIAIIAGLVAIGGVAAVYNYVMTNESTLAPIIEESKTERAEIAQENGYPALWAEAGLPEYPNGTLTKTREGRNLNDGIQVTLTTSDSNSVIKTFWDNEITSLGFTESPGFPGNEFAIVAQYKNGSRSLTLQITRIDDGPNNKVYLQYHE